jgi:hypothetical protein
LLQATIQQNVETPVAQRHSGRDHRVGLVDNRRHVAGNRESRRCLAKVEVAGQADPTEVGDRLHQRVDHTDQGDLRSRLDFEQARYRRIAGSGANVRRTGGENDLLGLSRQVVWLDRGEIGVQGSDPDRQGAFGKQVGQRPAGSVGAVLRVDLACFEGARAEDLADPQQHVVVAIGDIGTGQPGGVVQPESAGDVELGRGGSVLTGENSGGEGGDRSRHGRSASLSA